MSRANLARCAHIPKLTANTQYLRHCFMSDDGRGISPIYRLVLASMRFK